MREPPFSLARARRVGIVLRTGIGDVVHGLPIANDLKRDRSTRRVLWIVEPAPARILEHRPAVDKIVVYDKSRGVAGAVEVVAA